MNTTKRAVLRHVVDAWKSSSDPQAPNMVSGALNIPPAEVARALDTLEDLELIVCVDGCYRPTVTARELTEYGLLEEDLIIIDSPQYDSIE